MELLSDSVSQQSAWREVEEGKTLPKEVSSFHFLVQYFKVLVLEEVRGEKRVGR